MGVVFYNDGAITMNVSDARERLAEVIDLARSEAVVLERYGQPVAVLVSVGRYQQLLDAFEEAEDVVVAKRMASCNFHPSWAMEAGSLKSTSSLMACMSLANLAVSGACTASTTCQQRRERPVAAVHWLWPRPGS